MAHRICYLLSGVMLPFAYGYLTLNSMTGFGFCIGASSFFFFFGCDLEKAKKASQG